MDITKQFVNALATRNLGKAKHGVVLILDLTKSSET